jgi:hypothetical protein
MGNKTFKSSDGMFIPRRMNRSSAFRKLTPNSIFVLLEFMSRRKMSCDWKKGRWSITNNGEIIFPYAEADEKFKICRSTFCRSIDQLVKLGFIDIAHHGGGMMKDSSKYGISERWRDYNKEDFIKTSRKKDNRKLGFTKDNWEEQTGRKRKSKPKIGINNDTRSSITNDTCDHPTPITSSINYATHQIGPNYYIQKGLEVLEAMYPARYH